MSYYLFMLTWISLTIIWSVSLGVLGYKNSTEGGNWFWILFFCSFFPVWAVVSRYSRNIILDAIIMDLIIVFGTVIGLWYCGAAENLKTSQVIAILIMLSGFVLYNLKL